MKHLAMRAYLGIALALLALVSVALAQTGSDYDLAWWTVDGGGGTFAGEGYAVSGTAGQPDAGTLTGGSYTLSGGFWGGGVGPSAYTVYLPLTLRNLP